MQSFVRFIEVRFSCGYATYFVVRGGNFHNVKENVRWESRLIKVVDITK